MNEWKIKSVYWLVTTTWTLPTRGLIQPDSRRPSIDRLIRSSKRIIGLNFHYVIRRALSSLKKTPSPCDGRPGNWYHYTWAFRAWSSRHHENSTWNVWRGIWPFFHLSFFFIFIHRPYNWWSKRCDKKKRCGIRAACVKEISGLLKRYQ